MEQKLFIVSNRLPVNISIKDEGLEVKESLGGLATGLRSFYKDRDGRWIGWPGLSTENQLDSVRTAIEKKLLKENCTPVFVPDEDFRGYYNGFSNSTLWPLFHYFFQNAVYDGYFWESYKRVNQIFANEVIKVARSSDTIWIQDYHLMLLPSMIRNELPEAKIGFFLHTPFPSSEVYRLLPWREELLKGVLGADLIGFHTYDYVRHFLSSVRRIVGYEHEYGHIKTRRNMVKIDVFPIGIDFEKYAKSFENPDVLKARDIFKKPENQKVILTIDRLDYTKGIPNRLEAFERFLEKYPEWHGKITLIMLSAPSRTDVKSYQDLKQRVDKLVGSINGKYGSISWTPVHYLYRSIPFEKIAALYHLADICMVTPIRDGMNLVAKEFIATRRDNQGMLILSETAGAAQELSEALLVNPNNRDAIADSINQALVMPEEEQIERNKMMKDRIKTYNIFRWANDFIKELRDVKKLQKNYKMNELTNRSVKLILQEYKSAKSRLILLDYDGTLVNFTKKPEQAKPDNEVYEILKKISEDKKNYVYVISGRDKKTLTKWMKDLDIGIIAEHGVWFKEKNKDWKTLYHISSAWKKEIMPTLEVFTDRTPGSFIEEKEYSLVWHYRSVNPALSQVRVNELKDVLVQMTENLSLGVLDGNKVVEIKNLNINKGSAAEAAIKSVKSDFILAIGDDITDEDMFKVLPEDACSLRVGLVPSRAKYNIKTVEDVREFLLTL